MNGQWTMVAVTRPFQEGWTWAGLLILHAYDEDIDGSAPNNFEIWHRASGEFMLAVNATLERTQEIATEFANLADWAALSTTDEMMLQARVMAFGARYPGVVAVYNEWAAGSDLEHIVPYGHH